MASLMWARRRTRRRPRHKTFTPGSPSAGPARSDAAAGGAIDFARIRQGFLAPGTADEENGRGEAPWGARS